MPDPQAQDIPQPPPPPPGYQLEPDPSAVPPPPAGYTLESEQPKSPKPAIDQSGELHTILPEKSDNQIYAEAHPPALKPAMSPELAAKVQTAKSNIAQYPENQQAPDPEYVRRRAEYMNLPPEPELPEFDYDPEQERRIEAQNQVASKQSAIPQAAVPALEAAKKVVVDPFERAAAAGSRVGAQAGETAVSTGKTVGIPARGQVRTTTPETAPAVKGIARAAGGVAGGMVADPRMWPFFFAGPEVSAALRTASGAGFATQMGVGAVQSATELGAIMDRDDIPPEQKWELGANAILSAIMAGTGGAHLMGDFAHLPAEDQAQIRERLRTKAPELAGQMDKLNAQPAQVETAAPHPAPRTAEAVPPPPPGYKLETEAPKPAAKAPLPTGPEKTDQNLTSAPPAGDRYEEAKKLTQDFGKGSTSLLQRRLQIGYKEASSYVQRMRDEGIVEAQGAVPKVKPAEQPPTLPPEPKPATQVAPQVETPQAQPAVSAAPQPVEIARPQETGARPIGGQVEAPETPAQPERRTDVDERKRVAEMSPDERATALLTSDRTGLPNRRAFDEAEHQPAKAVAMSDADGLKALNDKFGYSSGNAMLKAKAEALKEAGLDAYHDKGDEFLFRGDSPDELKTKLDKAREILRDRIIQVETKDGQVLQFKGADFSHGSGQDLAEAEAGLKAHKSEREAAGERARGELRGIVETRPEERKEPQGAAPPAEEPAQPETHPASEANIAPGTRSAFTGNETGMNEMQQLTEAIRGNAEGKSLKERLGIGAKIGGEKSQGSPLSESLGKVKGYMAALWDAYRNPPKWGDYESSTGRWSGAEQANALDLDRFTREIKKAAPDKKVREAMSNWIEAGGDDSVLQERAGKSDAKFKPGYDAALKLTDAQKAIARNIQGLHDATLKEAIDAGLLEHGVDAYIQHVYSDKPQYVRKIMAEMNFSSLNPKPSFTKQRTLPTYFDAEQLGFTPKDKDVAYLTAVHERSLREALAARSYVKSLMEGKSADGRPLVATSWASAKEIGEPGKAAYLIKPNMPLGEEYADFRKIDHPALRGWKWATEIDGKPVMVQGDALVNPEIYRKLKNNLTKSALRSYEIEIGNKTVRPGAVALDLQNQVKQFILSFSGFHQTTLGIHALEHRTLPVRMAELDLNDATQKKLVDHGLMVAHYDAEEAFGEGVSSGGAITKIPGIGPAYNAYREYLFKSFMPRVKMEMAKNALERNTKLYKGKLSEDQIYGLTANQANAAFGGLNYRMLGRNKTFQDTLRLGLMAPDFTEARARFAGQAMKPYGMEQRIAFVGGALALYTLARLLNEKLDGQPHWSKPFSVVHNGKEYSLRTVQGDVLNLLENPAKFFANRLSPGARAITGAGQDRFPKKNQSVTDKLKERGRDIVPIPIQPWLQQGHSSNAEKAMESIFKLIGINEKKAERRAR